MKTEFYLNPATTADRASRVEIVGKKPDHKPYLTVIVPGSRSIGYLKGADLERLAVNILKVIGSKKLKANNHGICIRAISKGTGK